MGVCLVRGMNILLDEWLKAITNFIFNFILYIIYSDILLVGKQEIIKLFCSDSKIEFDGHCESVTTVIFLTSNTNDLEYSQDRWVIQLNTLMVSFKIKTFICYKVTVLTKGKIGKHTKH